ncbi:pilus assembly protein TadG-related protein [Jannaschia ovalis]|uniref:Pilus assembly protein TadG-related protein n=1 Tax=Jannaschia ovalis TaxID=3038773 RepID=A0ABY8LAW1_9RHOB|nr:pilus assembly protein TadG-related protein [Jannaschia sp. GRR-S6-38]WGH78424.1 pilus assembly protein TadG-related protein [Jannaschia sp. GRR-S6-38]
MPHSILTRFLSRDDGAATIHGLYWLLGMLVIGGIAVDGANSWRVKNQVRSATDAAALAAAQRLDDVPAARAAAVQIGGMNLDSGMHGSVINATDVSFGHFDSDSGFFVIDEVSPTAVKVDGQRSVARGNPIRMALLGMVGQDDMDLNTFSIAEAIAPPTAVPSPLHTCGNITVISEGFSELVGNAELVGPVCLHGTTGASASNNNLIASGAKVSAPSLDSISITTLRGGSDPLEEIKVEAHMDTEILPVIAQTFVDTWSTLWAMPDGATYQGPLIPASISSTGGPMTIRKVDDWWWQVKKQSEIAPNTIYLVNHGMKVKNGIDLSNVAFIVRGTMQMGGSNSDIRTIYALAEQAVDVMGSSTIGAPGFCSTGAFDSYILSPVSVKWRGSANLNGVVTASPVMDTTGDLQVDGGLYLEAGNDIKIRGSNNMTVCPDPLQTHFPIPQPYELTEDPSGPVAGLTPARLLR